jgi:tRNA A22 N-methylase
MEYIIGGFSLATVITVILALHANIVEKINSLKTQQNSDAERLREKVTENNATIQKEIDLRFEFLEREVGCDRRAKYDDNGARL